MKYINFENEEKSIVISSDDFISLERDDKETNVILKFVSHKIIMDTSQYVLDIVTDNFNFNTKTEAKEFVDSAVEKLNN